MGNRKYSITPLTFNDMVYQAFPDAQVPSSPEIGMELKKGGKRENEIASIPCHPIVSASSSCNARQV